MKRLIVIFCLLCSITVGIWGEGEFSLVEAPNPAEEAVILGLNAGIAAVQRRIEAHYSDMKGVGLIDANGKAVVPMKAHIQTALGSRIQFMYNEEGNINWNGAQIASFTFLIRKARTGTKNKTTKNLTGNVLRDPEGHTGLNDVSLTLLVTKILEPGPGSETSVLFRFPAGKTAQDTNLVSSEKGYPKTIQVVYVRKVQQKIGMLREYQRLLKLLLRRVDWLIRSKSNRNERIVDQFMNNG